ncbi:TonB family protein [Henriciella marina]|uniref:TonB family protein n=1 Tax=Henriciella marina TaxID=453851 RepID=A0ABT4LXY4_9PROT|nr:TonB family protein [Henriciella marina]MCZ4298982.1 TonB family protein [Henriciella marina]
MIRVALLTMSVVVFGVTADAQSDADEDAVPIVPPVPTYPPMAAMLGLEGYCEVRFSVDENGYTFSLTTSCTQPIFCYQSKKAVSLAQFEPKRIGGRALPRFNVVYPLEYRLEGEVSEINMSSFGPCDENSVS